MPPLSPAAAVAQLTATQEKFFSIVEGPATGEGSTVPTEGNPEQKTVARILDGLEAAGGISSVENYAAVAGLDASDIYEGKVIAVRGAATDDDGGAGVFQISDDITEDVDAGVTLATASSRKARRIYSGKVDGEWYSLSQNPANAAANATKMNAIIAEASRKRVAIQLPGIATGESPFELRGQINADPHGIIHGHGPDRSILSWGENVAGGAYADSALLAAKGSHTSLGALDEDASLYKTVFNLAAAPDIDLTGRWLKIVNPTNKSYSNWRDEYRQGQEALVLSNSGAEVTLAEGLLADFAAATTIVYLMNEANPVFEGFQIIGKPGAGNFSPLLLHGCGPNTRLDGIKTGGSRYCAMSVLYSVGPRIDNYVGRNFSTDVLDATSGYGLIIVHSSRVKITNPDITSTRHAIASGGIGGAGIPNIVNRYLQISGGDIGIVANAPISVSGADFHGNTELSEIAGTTVRGGFQWGGHRITVRNCNIISGTARGYQQFGLLGSEWLSTAHTVENNLIDVSINGDPDNVYGTALDVGTTGSTIGAATVRGGTFVFRNNSVRMAISAAGGTVSTIRIRNIDEGGGGSDTTDMSINISDNEFFIDGTDATLAGIVAVNNAGGHNWLSVTAQGNRGRYALDLRDASRADLTVPYIDGIGLGVLPSIYLSGITDHIDIGPVRGIGGSSNMILIEGCSGATVHMRNPEQRGNYGADAIKVNTDCTVYLDGWDLVGTNANVNITNVVTALRYNPGYQGGIATFAATTVAKLGVEKGTYTPTIAGSTTPGAQTYVYQVGKYIAEDDRVTIQGICQISAKDVGIAGNIQQAGLPFPVSNITNLYQSFAATFIGFVTLTAGYTQFGGVASPNASAITLFQLGSGVGTGTIAVAAMNDTDGNHPTIGFGGTYFKG